MIPFLKHIAYIRFIILLLIGLIYASAHLLFSQNMEITGQITNEQTGAPIENASVFFANSTTGVSSNAKGDFTLTVKKEQALNLIISHISYNTLKLKLPREKDLVQLSIQLQPKEHILQSIDVFENTIDRQAALHTFKKAFFGTSRFANKCKIENPDVLDFISSGVKGFSMWKFAVISNGPMEYTNNALGYKVSYTMVYFNANDYQISYYGYPLYEDVIEEYNARRILKNRQKAYEGSKLHFFRSLARETITEEGFEVYKLKYFVKDSADQKNYGLMEDSVFIGYPGVVMLQTDQQLDIEKYVRMNFKTGVPELTINEPFEVRYVRKKEALGYLKNPENFKGMNNARNVQTTIVKIKDGKLSFYRNGSLDTSDELMTIGYWSYKRMGDFLPFDYTSE